MVIGRGSSTRFARRRRSRSSSKTSTSRDKYEVSVAAGERALLPIVRRTGADVLLIADGFSCREQIRQRTGRLPLHLAEVVARAYEERRETEERRDAARRGRELRLAAGQEVTTYGE